MPADKYLAYTYLIGWSKQDLWYYGVRYTQNTQKRKIEFDLWIDYYTHSIPVKHMRAFIGEPDVIHYDKIFECDKEAREYESKVLEEHNVKKSSHWLNKHISGKNFTTNRKKSIIINGILYESRTEAAKKLGLNRTTINRWAKNGVPTKEETRLNRSNAQKGKKKSKKSIEKRLAKVCKKVKINNMIFNSRKEAASYYNISPPAMGEWIEKGKAEYIS